MNPYKTLVLALLALISFPITPAEQPSVVRGTVGRTSFWINIPKGWETQKLTTRYQASTPLFDLTPIGAKSPQEFPNATFFYIRAAYYPDRTPIAARLRWEPKGGPVTELPRFDGLPNWSISRGIGITAFAPIGDDVVLFHLACSGEQQCTQGQKVLVEILTSYTEVGKSE